MKEEKSFSGEIKELNDELYDNTDFEDNWDEEYEEYEEYEDEENNNSEEKEDLIIDKKENKEVKTTEELIAKHLTDAFLVLSSMLDEAKVAKENIEKIYNILNEIVKITENIKNSTEKINEINQIVEHIDVLVKAITVNNSNIQNLIEIVGELNKRQKNMQKEIGEIKLNNFIDTTEEKTEKKSKKISIEYVNMFLIFSVLILIFVKFFL